jgi:hypothetical protein
MDVKLICQTTGDAHLQKFGIIHLPNTDLTYISNREINKIMFMLFHLLKTYIRNPSIFFISLFTFPPYKETLISTTRDEFCQVSIFTKLVCQSVEGQFFLFCQI